METSSTMQKLTDIPVSQAALETDILAFAYNGTLSQCTEGVLVADVKKFIDNSRPE